MTQSKHLPQLERALNAAVSAINAALNVAQLVQPEATLYLEAGGVLYALKPEVQTSGDTTTTQRMRMVFASSSIAARCDVGAW